MDHDEKLKSTIDKLHINLMKRPNDRKLADISDEDNSISYISGRYEYLIGQEARKKTGSFYTDRPIVRYMLEEIFKDLDIAKNPFLRILDPACGCGYFLLEAYDILKERFQNDLYQINLCNPGLGLKSEDIHEHIIRNNLFGADLDEYGVKLTAIGLMLKSPKCSGIPNIICCDSIIYWENTIYKEREFWSYGFDIIIGNPPYIGHKKTDGEYRKLLKSIYGDIFKDKADISFCFIKSSLDRLNEGGQLSFITSRYFLESPSGKALRDYVCGSFTIERIVDFYGIRIMKGISVDPVIVFIKKDIPGNNYIRVIKAQKGLKDLDIGSVFDELKNEGSCFEAFNKPQGGLNSEGWVLCTESELEIIKKLEQKLSLRLSDVCESFQGIITGCDSAFIIDEETACKNNIERDILRPWIKNRNIDKYTVSKSEKYIIYSDFIKDPVEYKNSASYIEKYRDRLERRRECIKGSRKWYELQWGRVSSLFEMEKIVFPYKSSTGRFALDKGNYSSADVYGMYLKDEYKDKFSYEFLLGLLNSRVYEFYFKSFGKKLGADLYDYYPNTVMRLCIPKQEDEWIKKKVSLLLNCSEKQAGDDMIMDIDNYIYNIFNLSSEDIKIIERRLKRL